MVRLLGTVLVAGAALWGCAVSPPATGPTPQAGAPSGPGAAAPHYRCDQGIEFTVRFADDSAFIDSPKRGSEVLLRDAGGVTPQQSVYSNARMRAEFGLGTGGREAKLRYLPEPQVTHCLRD